MRPCAAEQHRARDNRSTSPVSVSPSTGSDDAYCHISDGSADRVPESSSLSKKRKTTYYARKYEQEDLYEEADALSGELKTIHDRQIQRHLPLQSTVLMNAALRSSLMASRRVIAQSESLMSSYNPTEPPIGNYIHLPRDMVQRQQLILAMKPNVIHDAREYILQRCQFLDLSRPCRQLENFVTPDGDYISVHWEIVLFDQHTPTVARVFNEMMYFVRSQEMEMAEKLGSLSVRESDVTDEITDAAQVRLVSTQDNGLLVEKNILVFSQSCARAPRLDQPHGVFVVDYVDQDDVFPYQPDSRVREHITSAALVLECPPHSSDSHTPRSIALVRYAFLKIHDSKLTTCDVLDELSRESIRRYFDSMVRVIRERLEWSAS